VYIIADNHFSVSTFPVVTVNRFSTKVLLASGISIALRIDQNTLLFKSLGSVKHFFYVFERITLCSPSCIWSKIKQKMIL